MRPFVNLPSSLIRTLAIIRTLINPVRLAQVFLDFTSVVRSQFWDGRRTGPDFVSPMASLTRRRSGYLAKVVLEHSKNLPTFEPDYTDSLHQTSETMVSGVVLDDPLQNGKSGTVPEQHTTHSQAVAVSNFDTIAQRHQASDSRTIASGVVPDNPLQSAASGMTPEHHPVHPQAVAVLNLDDVPQHRLESQYTTPADADLMVLVPILLNLLVILATRNWSPSCWFIIIDFIAALILGPGTLTLIRGTTAHPTELDPDPGCSVLMDDDFTVVIRGSQRIVEAVTEGGFYLSLAHPRRTQGGVPVSEIWKENQVIFDLQYGALEGTCRGVCEGIVMRFLQVYSGNPYLKAAAYVFVMGRVTFNAFLWVWRASNHSVSPTGTTPLRLVARLIGELMGLLIAVLSVVSESSGMILPESVSLFLNSFHFGLFAQLGVLQSQNCRIRTERLLDALGRPSIKKWPFHTRASAATFACLVLCQDIPRPVRGIHLMGVLDALIPNQRDVWIAWKERVADRIGHEEQITFAPTIPTFPDERQERLKRLLDEAQFAYNTYRSHYPNTSDV